MSSVAEHQAANALPPRRGAVLALAIDSTARPYALASLDLAGYTQGTSPNQQHVFVTLQAITADVWFYFSSATASDLDHAAAISAGSALAYANTYGWRLPQNEERSFRLNRNLDRFLIVKTATGTATLLIAASSESF